MYILFMCMDCGAHIAYPAKTADGRRCLACDSGLIGAIGSGSYEALENRCDGLGVELMSKRKSKAEHANNNYTPRL